MESIPQLRRIAPAAALAGGLIVALHSLTHWALYGAQFDLAQVALIPEWTVLNAFLLAGMILLLLGLVGIYGRQAHRAGTFGLVAFLMLFVGFTLRAGLVFMEILMVPTVARDAPHVLTLDPPPLAMGIGFLVEMGTKILGLMLFGVATIRAAVYPRTHGYLLVGGVLVSLVPMVVPLGIALVATSFAAMGAHDLVAATPAEKASPDPASTSE